MTFNCFNDLDVEAGQIMWGRFVRVWKLFIYAPKERKERHMSAQANMCKELH